MDSSLHHIRERYDRLCRFCLSEQECIPVFTGDYELNERLSKTLDVLLAKIDETDGLPNNVCLECVRCIERFVDFEATCARSYELLEKARQSSSSVQEIVCEEPPEVAADELIQEEESLANNELETLEEPEILAKAEPMEEHLDDEIDASEEPLEHIEETIEDVPADVELDKPIESTSYNLSEEHQKLLDAAMETEPCGFIDRSNRKIPIIECIYCKNVYRGRNTLKKHLRIHLNIKDYQCKHCSRSYTDLNSLRIHESHHGEKSLGCPHCDKTYFSRNELRQHMTMQHLERKYSCETCQQKFPSKSILNDHRLVHLPDRPFVCKFCGIGFKRNRNLLRHQTTCDTPRSIDCMVCSKPLKSPKLLLEHLVKQHSESYESLRNKPNTCRNCDAGVFTDLENYLKHLQEHWQVAGAYLCGECNKNFKTKIAILRHLKLHNGDRNYSCEVHDCRTYYKSKSRFDKHMSETH